VKRWARHFGLLLGLAATTGFVFYAVHALRGQDLSQYLSVSALGGLALAAAGYSLVIPMSALAWRRLLGDMGVTRGWGELSIIMAVSQLAKYIPGNIGQHVGRAAMAVNRGIPLRPYGTSVLSEAVLAVIAAAITGVVGCGLAGMGSELWTRHVGAPLPSLAMLALAFVLAVVAVRRLLPGILQHLVPGMRNGPMVAVLPGNRGLGVAFAIYVLNYAVLGAGLTAMVMLLLPGREASWLLLTGCFALAWVIGFFAPGAPAGLGVREGLLLALLQFSYTRPDALLIVITLRLATTAGDVLCFLIGAAALFLAHRRSGTRTPLFNEPTVTAMKLEPTGERMIVEHYKSSIEDYVIYLMHIATYRFAEPFAKNKRVLDYGCGSGYGSARMAQTAARVDAVDVAEDAITHARTQFPHDNLHFRSIDPTAPLPFAEGSFDTVLSFQVFEHVTNVGHYLSEIRRVLVPGGTLVLVTPDRSTRLLPLQRPWNRWHVKEYSAESLAEAMRRTFPEVQMLRMSGRRDVIDVELRRCSRLKWLTLPFTLPILPDPLRVWLLNRIHLLRGRPGAQSAPLEFDFDESAIEIGVDLRPSLNLVAIARY